MLSIKVQLVGVTRVGRVITMKEFLEIICLESSHLVQSYCNPGDLCLNPNDICLII